MQVVGLAPGMPWLLLMMIMLVLMWYLSVGGGRCPIFRGQPLHFLGEISVYAVRKLLLQHIVY